MTGWPTVDGRPAGLATAVEEEAEDVTVDDFITGLLAAFAERHIAAVSIRGNAFYRAAENTYSHLRTVAAARGLDVRFRIRLDPIYEDSPVLREAISAAVQRDLVSLDNPEYQDMRLKIGSDESALLLASLPGTGDLYRSLADTFLDNYSFIAMA